ncbi:MAG: helix-turn-helix transcriptional regulator [Candidatus Diapherotrites archaeon]|nr:helix-turn-helix transcriptional regulator [Candidatus Diapherotrites archaeon]
MAGSIQKDSDPPWACSVLVSAHLIGKKWSLILLTEFRHNQFKGFKAFEKKTGITARTLSRQLHELEQEGLLEKKKNIYRITPKGSELCTALDALRKWNIEWNRIPASCPNRSCTECGRITFKQKGRPE